MAQPRAGVAAEAAIEEVLAASEVSGAVRALVTLTALTGQYPREADAAALQSWIRVGARDRALRLLRRAVARSSRHARTRLPMTAPSLVVDVTRTSRATSITGIPRVARAVADVATARGGAMIVWSGGVPALARVASDGVIQLQQPSRRSHGWTARAVRSLKRVYWRALDLVGRTRVGDRVAEMTRGLLAPVGSRLFAWESPAHLLILTHCRYLLPEVPVSDTVSRLLPWVEHAPGMSLGVVVHDLLPVNAPGFFRPDQRVEHIEFCRVISRALDLVVAAPHVRTEVEGVRRVFGAPLARPVRVVPYGGGLPDTWVDRRHRADRTRFLMLGSLDDRKNHATVLRALGLLAQEGVTTTLHIVGTHRPASVGTRQALDYAVSRGVSVVRHEQLSDDGVRLLAAECAALVYPSWAEGYGLPVLEALSSGMPVVASDIPSNRDHVALGGVVLVPVDDEPAMADALRSVVSDAAWYDGLVTSIRRGDLPVGFESWAEAVIEVGEGDTEPPVTLAT